MPPKRTRRVSPAPAGLTAGERLKRSKMTGSISYSAWGWVGTDVSNASDITEEHRLATCGLSKRSPHYICPNKYSVERNPAPVKEKTKGKQASGELDDDIIVISDDETPQCSSKVCKNNPYCLNYLGQEKWEDEDKARQAFLKVANLGENPLLYSRESAHPAGLKNLGATCYANAFLQVWFQDLPFRSGVYQCQLPQDAKFKPEESPIFQLQVTFAAMQEGIQSAFNPVKLVESLKLRTSEQQDAQEFSKLFMAHLDTEFRKQSKPALKTLIPDQFQGKQIYGTICENCRHRSEHVSDFLEIEVNLKNNATLEDRIAALLEPETLSGDNKYFCPQCNGLQDAKRYTELKKLPPRKKSKHTICFPTTIDMDRFMGSSESRKRDAKQGNQKTGNLYELRGVLLHKGASAYHGHYEAQVFDVQNRAWYQFNDETVTKIDSLGTKTDSATKDAPKTAVDSKKKSNGQPRTQRGNPKKRRRIDDSDSDVEIIENSTRSSSENSTDSQVPLYISSKEAYMLVYSRVDGCGEAVAEPVAEGSCRLPRNIKATSPNTSTPTDLVPPLRAKDTVDTMNNAHEAACRAFIEKERQMIARFDEMRRKILDIYRSWQLTTRDEDAVVASRQGLESWMSRHLVKPKASEGSPAAGQQSASSSADKTEQPEDDAAILRDGTISMSQIVCSHGKLDADKANDVKLISKAAYERITSDDQCKFVPELLPSDVCPTCVEATFTERLYQSEHPQLVARFDDVSPVGEDEQGFWISKQWLKDWRLSKPKMHVFAQQDPPPDAPDFEQHVKCEHGGLSANITGRRRISAEASLLLQELFPSWKPIATNTELCPVCEALVHISKEDKREVRRQAEEEKAKLKHMHDNALNGNTALLENVPCVLISAQFIRSWRQWLLHPGEVPRPKSVDNSMFMCEHGLLSLDPNVSGDMDISVAVIKRSDWDIIEDIYSGGPLIAVENTGAGMQHDISVCEECRIKRKSTFDVTNITVRTLGPNEPLPTPGTQSNDRTDETKRSSAPSNIMTYGSRKAGGLRQSNRIRQGKEQGKRRRVTITKTMSVKDLKVLLQEELNIPIILQRLFYQGTELDDSSATVLSLGILSNDLIELREEGENIDLLSDSEDNTKSRKAKRKEGQGFGGTLLSGLASSDDVMNSASQHEPTPPTSKACSACTFENELDSLACAICDTPFVCDA